MINLRYHIVSIVAVFLALGIGTALGGTLLDRYTVNLLEQSIGNAETRIADTEKKNDRLSSLNDDAAKRDTALLAIGGDRLLGDRLLDVPVLVITAPGVKTGDGDDLRTALTDAGADLRGTLELRTGLAFKGEVDRGLADTVGLSPDDPGAVRAAVLGSFHGALADATAPVAEAPSTTTTTTTTPGDPSTTVPAPTTTVAPVPTITTDPTAPTTEPSVPGDGSAADPAQLTPAQPDIVTALLAADYVRFTPGPGHGAGEPILETAGYRLVFVSATGDDPGPNTTMLDLLRPGATVDPILGVVTTSGSSAPEPIPETDAVAQIRASDDLADRFSTVDDTDTFSGLVATVFALEDLSKPTIGHYGTADGATAPLPPRA